MCVCACVHSIKIQMSYNIPPYLQQYYQQFLLVIQILKISSAILGLGVYVPSCCLTKLLRSDHRKTHLTLKGKTMHRPRQVWLTEPN